MATLIDFEVKLFPPVRVIGKQVTGSIKPGDENPVPRLWESMMMDGTLAFLTTMAELVTADSDTVGWMGEYDPATSCFTYIAGVLTKPGTPVPDGCVARDLPACEMAIASIRGRHEGGDLYAGAHDITWNAMKEHGYEYDSSAGGFEMEYYSHMRFAEPITKGERVVVMEFYSPCKKSP